MRNKNVPKFDWLEFQFWLQDRWDDLTSPIENRWWRFRQWRRRRNPELVELDAFRELVEVEDRLERYPNAVPLLEAALKLYEITGQKRMRGSDPFGLAVMVMQQKDNAIRRTTCRR